MQGTQLIWAAPPNHFIFIDADLNTQKPDYAASGGFAPTPAYPDSRASDAGLREGDVIRQVDGKAIHSAAELRSALSGRSDRPALMLVQRGDNSFFATIEG